MRLSGAIPINYDGQEDNDSSPGSPICTCKTKIGVPVSFWEPVRIAESTRSPYCMVSLGGISLDPGVTLPGDTRGKLSMRGDERRNESFFQEHWFMNPLMYVLELVLDDNCIEMGGIDIVYFTEADPMWSDDTLGAVLQPMNFLFGSLPVVMSMSYDCILANLDMSPTVDPQRRKMFYAAGCDDPIYPLSGKNPLQTSGPAISSKLAQRFMAKMHNQGMMWGTTGNGAFCGYYPKFMYDKTNYKMQMLYPIPEDKNDWFGTKCCHAPGRSANLWGNGKEFPVKGEDFSYQIFRKRDCCQGAYP